MLSFRQAENQNKRECQRKMARKQNKTKAGCWHEDCSFALTGWYEQSGEARPTECTACWKPVKKGTFPVYARMCVVVLLWPVGDVLRKV